MAVTKKKGLKVWPRHRAIAPRQAVAEVSDVFQSLSGIVLGVDYFTAGYLAFITCQWKQVLIIKI